MNAYEYIMEVMSAPQYWGVDNLPLYNLDYEQEHSYEVLKKQNRKMPRLRRQRRERRDRDRLQRRRDRYD